MNRNDVLPRKIVVLGLGNPDRGDDGVGAIVIRKLAGRLPPEVALRTRCGDMLSLIEDWAGFDAAICIDAAAPAGKPGRIRRIDLTTGALPREPALASSHAFGLADAVELARALRCAPRHILVYAIEGACFESGVPVGPKVAAAAAAVAKRLVAEIGRLCRDEAESRSDA